jgi:hypothetical protein
MSGLADDPLESLLSTLRKHNVAKYAKAGDGAVTVEFYPGGQMVTNLSDDEFESMATDQKRQSVKDALKHAMAQEKEADVDLLWST